MLERGRILVITDGAAAMTYALPLVDLLSNCGIKTVFAPTAYQGGALSFTTEFGLAAISGSPCVDIATLTPEIIAKYDGMVMAPISLSVLNVFKSGIAKDLLTALKHPLIVVPALMSNAADADLQELSKWQEQAPCQVKMLLPEGDTISLGRCGKLQIAAVERCHAAIDAILTDQTLAGKKVLITAGPTIEDIDPVRYISNRSTGKMGLALVQAALRHGAMVDFICGPVHLNLPKSENLNIIPVRSASQMNNAVLKQAAQADIAILCAAVADFTPNIYVEHKIKKGADDNLTLLLKRTPDILAGLGAMEHKPFLVGFAAESDDLEQNAIIKMQHKHCDMLCANDITEPGCGFAVDTNRITIYYKDGGTDKLDLMTKSQAAEAIIDAITNNLK